MRRLRYAVAMSLDGYIAGPSGEADWIVIDPEIDFESMFSEFDTLLMGRRTFEVAAGTGGGSPGNGLKTVVVSRTLRQQDHPRVTIVSGDVKRAVTDLKAQPGKDIWLFGGGLLFRSLLELGLVNTVEVGVIPVLLGQGIPLLPSPGTRVGLTLTTHRIYAKTGTVGLSYDIQYTRARTGRRRRAASAR